MRQGKNYVEVADGEQFFLACREPAPTSRDLTLGAVSIATGVENDDTVATTGALMEMSTQDCGTAVGDGAKYLLVHPVDPAPVVGDEVFALCPYNVGHLQVWPLHFFCSLRDLGSSSRFEICSWSSGLGTVCRCLCDRCK